jgi:hypothetical protein
MIYTLNFLIFHALNDQYILVLIYPSKIFKKNVDNHYFNLKI